MNRRKIIKYVAYATGAAVAAPLASSLLVSCQTDATAAATTAVTSQLQFFNSNQFAVIQEMVDIILPETDSPAASSVGVHNMIDRMVGIAYRPKAKEEYKEKLASFFEYLKEKGYGDLDGAGKLTLLNTLDKSKEETVADAKAGYLNLKQQTIAYYLSSEEIGTKFLNYLPVPGEYEPCISLAEAGGKAWAL